MTLDQLVEALEAVKVKPPLSDRLTVRTVFPAELDSVEVTVQYKYGYDRTAQVVVDMPVREDLDAKLYQMWLYQMIKSAVLSELELVEIPDDLR